MSKTPHDLLPIKRPLEDDNEYDETYFYDNVIQYLIPDIIQMEANGIPINLDKVGLLENTVDNVLTEVHKKLKNNTLMFKFLEFSRSKLKNNKIEQLYEKKKTIEDFIKPFDINNKVHRNYVINTYLQSKEKESMCLDTWTTKNLKKLNTILCSSFIQSIIDKDESFFKESPYKLKAMEKLAQDKLIIYTKNKIESKVESIKQKEWVKSFNPGSSIQRQQFFEFYGITSEKKTAKGSPQWDRGELERLQKFLNVMIDKKGESYGSES